MAQIPLGDPLPLRAHRGLVWCIARLCLIGRPVRYQLLPVLGFHLWAMWPDLAFRAGVPHEHWMDWLALGHVSSHYLPGGDTAWLVVGLTAAGAYAVLLSRWLAGQEPSGAPPRHARRREP